MNFAPISWSYNETILGGMSNNTIGRSMFSRFDNIDNLDKKMTREETKYYEHKKSDNIKSKFYPVLNSCYEKSSGSFLISELSLKEALLIPYLGLSKDSQLYSAFKKLFSYDSDQLLNHYKIINDAMIGTKKVKIANSMWKQNASIYNNFIKMLSGYAEIKNTLSQGEINKWISEKTNNMIRSLEVDARDKDVVLINTIYFNDKWKNKFNKENTIEKYFYNLQSKRIPVKMMSNFGKYKYMETQNEQVIKIDYESNYSMFVMLPKKLEKPKLLLSVVGYCNDMALCEVELSLPKFTFESTHDLLEHFVSLGYNISDVVKYDNMSDDAYYIKKIIQKTKIECDEEGTKAAAVTCVMKNSFSAEPSLPQNIIFNANHSFAFCIVHNPSSEVLFSGVFNG